MFIKGNDEGLASKAWALHATSSGATHHRPRIKATW
jgi:hypothetical protein